jgi:hypothetical protein
VAKSCVHCLEPFVSIKGGGGFLTKTLTNSFPSMTVLVSNSVGQRTYWEVGSRLAVKGILHLL